MYGIAEVQRLLDRVIPGMVISERAVDGEVVVKVCGEWEKEKVEFHQKFLVWDLNKMEARDLAMSFINFIARYRIYESSLYTQQKEV